MEIDKKVFWISFGASLLIYAASFFSWLLTPLNYVFFVAITFLLGYLLSRDFTWSIPILIFESIISSQGKLLEIDFFNFTFSLRYLVFILVFIFALKLALTEKIWQKIKWRINFQSQNFWWALGLTFISLAVIIGLLSGTKISDIFYDANAYGFWLIWPIFYWCYRQKNNSGLLDKTLTLAVAAIFAQTFATYLLFITQIIPELQPLFYVWARDVRLAEMTKIGEYGVRIFWQSHVWAVLALGLASILLWLKKINYYYLAAIFVGLATLSSMLSFSRSFLLALVVALIITLILSRIIYVPKHEWRQLIQTLGASFFVCLLLLVGTMYLARQHFITWEDLGESRWSNLTTEQASASRMEELKPLWQQILKSPLFGSGFGYKLTYQSFDPRQNVKPYTTYAFEWGYLDMWLKMGLLFIMTLAGFIYITFKKYYNLYLNGKIPDYVFLLLIFSLTFLLITHLTTPYLNHPIGLVMLFWLASYMPSYQHK